MRIIPDIASGARAWDLVVEIVEKYIDAALLVFDFVFRDIGPLTWLQWC
jgi:hypothetical protein